MRNRTAMLVGSWLICVVTLGAQGPDPIKAAAGQQVYETQKCVVCHAIKGQGGKRANTLDGVGARLPPADIKKWITDPAAMEAKLPKKPSMSMSSVVKAHKLADEDVDNLVAYLMSLR